MNNTQNKKPKKIFIVDDDPKLVKTLQYELESLGYEVIVTCDGSQVMQKYNKHGPFSAIVLDVNLQRIDGFTILEQIRQVDSQTGIIMLTARNSDKDKIHGLKKGADDYHCKPFNKEELIMRISRMASRSDLIGIPDYFSNIIEFKDFQLDRENLKLITPAKKEILITVLEVELLFVFIKNKGRVLSREFLLHNVWKAKGNLETRTVDNYIVRLRKILEPNPSSPEIIISVRGRGYKMII